MRILDKELKGHRVATRVELISELLLVMGHRGQLQETIINLIQNSIEAMETVDDKQRELQVKTELHGGNSIRVTIADTGPGIDPKKSNEMFEAFFTTKIKRDGVGISYLPVCRMIVERYGGELSASPASSHGAIFQIILPQWKPEWLVL